MSYTPRQQTFAGWRRLIEVFCTVVTRVDRRAEFRGMSAVPANQRRKTDDKRENPHRDDQQFGSGGGHESRVADRSTDGDIAVNADGDKIVDRSCTHPDVDCKPDSTPRIAERPITQHLHIATHRH